MNQMKYVVIILFIINGHLQAQDTYIEGYLVLNNGDTLRGGLKHRRVSFTGESLLNKIKYKGENGKKKKFRRSQLKAYNIGGQEYRRFYLRPTRTKLLNLVTNYYEIVPFNAELHFLRVVRDGALQLYEMEWSDGMSDRVEGLPLFRKENDPLMVRGTQGVFGFKKNVLEEFFNDCPALQEKIIRDDFQFPFEVADFYDESCI